jgi:ABC-2 type transport system permease protein
MTAIALDNVRTPRADVKRVPMTRVTAVELRKMFDTRSGFWLMASIVLASVVATVSVILFAEDRDLTYNTFGKAIGFPMAVILPIIALLSVTSEWSQRSGLTTFTLVPHRGRVVLAKAGATVVVAVASMALALAIGVLGNLLGAALNGVSPHWDMTPLEMLYILIGNTLGMMIGFMLGLLIRNSPGAIVGYFVFSLVLPTLSEVLNANASWWHDVRPWLDFNFAQGNLFSGDMGGEQWAQLGVASLIWLIIPLAVGVRLVLRSEVK